MIIKDSKDKEDKLFHIIYSKNYQLFSFEIKRIEPLITPKLINEIKHIF